LTLSEGELVALVGEWAAAKTTLAQAVDLARLLPDSEVVLVLRLVDPVSGAIRYDAGIPRCPLAIDDCSSSDPGLAGTTPGHLAACILLTPRE
jgi:hypothetical protein